MTMPNVRGRQSYCPKCFQLRREKPCPNCQFSEDARKDPLLLAYPVQIFSKRYVVGVPIGRGEFSAIYLAFDKTEKQILVAKEYLPWSIVSRPDGRNLIPKRTREDEFHRDLRFFEEEADILQQLGSHDSIARCWNHFRDNGTAYIILEYCGSRSFADILKERNSPLSEEEVLRLFSPILDALDIAHRKKIFHCDINLRNIHAREKDNSRPVLLDFGSAQFHASTGNPPRPITINPGYSAPEQHAGDTEAYGAWTDIYACSATLYQLTTGRVPPQAPSREISDTLLPPKHFAADLSHSFSSTIMQGLSLDRFQRPQSIQDFRTRLEATQRSPESIRVPSPHTRSLLESFRKLKLSLMPLVTILLLASLIYFIFFRPMADPVSTPSKTADSYTIDPLDYYILRDVSGSHRDFDLYDKVEGIIKKTSRPSARNNPDYLTYAHFAAFVTNGHSTLEPATQHPDIIGWIKVQLRRWRPPQDFHRRTNFDDLFRKTLTAIKNSDQERGILVFVLTDGVPDITGHENVCVGARSGFFDDSTRNSFLTLIRETRANLMIALLGGRAECAGGVKQQWTALRRLLPKDDQARVQVISLGGYASVLELERALLISMRPLRRLPALTVRPAMSRLSDDQRLLLDDSKEFSADIVVQAHLGDNLNLGIPRADIRDAKGDQIAVLDVVNRSHGDPGEPSDSVIFSKSSGAERDEPGRSVTLFFQPRGRLELNQNEKYQIRPVVELLGASRTLLVTPPFINDIVADLGPRARIGAVHAQRLRVAGIISGCLAILMIACLVRYIRFKNGHRIERLIRFLILEPLKWWIGLFVLAALLVLSLSMFFMVGLHWLNWIVGFFSLLVAIISACGIITQPMQKIMDLSKKELFLFSLDAILIPLISFILTWAA